MESTHDPTCGGCARERATEHTRDGIGRRTFLAQRSYATSYDAAAGTITIG